jgi:hypothetical protein
MQGTGMAIRHVRPNPYQLFRQHKNLFVLFGLLGKFFNLIK